jgi:hypothetical protein
MGSAAVPIRASGVEARTLVHKEMRIIEPRDVSTQHIEALIAGRVGRTPTRRCEHPIMLGLARLPLHLKQETGVVGLELGLHAVEKIATGWRSGAEEHRDRQHGQ